MTHILASQSPSLIVTIGKDNGYTDGWHYMRRFSITHYHGSTLLTETRSSPHFADFSRTFEIVDSGGERPIIQEYVDEAGDNHSKMWKH